MTGLRGHLLDPSPGSSFPGGNGFYKYMGCNWEGRGGYQNIVIPSNRRRLGQLEMPRGGGQFPEREWYD